MMRQDPRLSAMAAAITVLLAGCGGAADRDPGSVTATGSPDGTGTTTSPAQTPTGPAATTPPPDNSSTPGSPSRPGRTGGPDSTSAPPPGETEDLPVPDQGPRVTVTGTVERGVEAGCLVLSSGGVTYSLLGAGARLRPGTRVTVDGTLPRSIATTCQQGRPLRVTAVRGR